MESWCGLPSVLSVRCSLIPDPCSRSSLRAPLLSLLCGVWIGVALEYLQSRMITAVAESATSHTLQGQYAYVCGVGEEAKDGCVVLDERLEVGDDEDSESPHAEHHDHLEDRTSSGS